MDFMQDNEEDSKYAFLLGSALRSDDTEQLFVVYDNLIPSCISDFRLGRIKEGARYISELPDDDFNALVLNARTFSLASGRSSAVCSSSMDSHSAGLCLDEEEEGEAVSIMQGESATTTSYGSLNHQTSSKREVDDSFKIDILEDQDSGFRGSSSFKASSIKNSISCSESNDDSDEDRTGCFDYTQLTQKSRSREHVRIRPTVNPEYDEDHKVDSSTGGSSIESPRSETSVTHEEYCLADDIEMQELNHSSQDYNKRSDSCYSASVKAVNEHEYLYGNWSSLEQKRAGTLKNSYNCCQDPILGSSTGAAAEPNSRVSKRTRAYSKDDSDKVTSSPLSLDVNGNPQLDISNYPQMRQSVNPGKVVEGGSSSLSALSNHQSLTESHAPLSKEPVSDLEKKRQRKLKKQEKQLKGQPAEELANYKGRQPIDELLNYIEGGVDNNHKKRGASKSLTAAQPQTVSVAGGKGDKQKKKQEKNKKDLDGPKEKTTADYVQPKSPPSVTASSSIVMGNSTAKDSIDESSISTTTITATATTTTSTSPTNVKNNVTIAEDHDHNSGEFFDCLNSLPGDENVSGKEQNKNIQLPVNAQVVLESNNKMAKPETTVSSKNSKTDVKNSTGMKNNSKKHKNEDVITDVDQYSSWTEQTKSLESKDRMLNTDKIKDVLVQTPTQAFIEYKKKKKRNVSKEVLGVTNLGNLQQNHSSFSKDTTNGIPSYNKWRPQRPPPSGVSSTTSSNFINSNQVESNNKPTSLAVVNNSKDDSSLDTFSRDLSPSAFPVLIHTTTSSSTGPPRPERRNSCGDISDIKAEVVSETRSYCDSDMESVKSLPAAHNVRAAGECSPSFPVSYATMVAAAQRERHRNQGDSSHSPSSESGIVCGSQASSIHSCHPHSSLEMVSPPPLPVPPVNDDNGGGVSCGACTPDRKTTVWKGSPRERRHSIGSSPDDNKPETEKCSISSRNRQKSGSQECLALIVTSSSSLPGSKEAAKESDSIPSDEEQPVSPENNAVCLEMEPESRNKSSSITPNVKCASSSSSSIKSTCSNQTSYSHNPPSISFHATQDLTSSQTSSSELVGGRNPAITTAISVSKQTVAAKSGSEAAITRKSNVNNTKSVIFLDERFGSNKTSDLGITFGFDDSIEAEGDFQILSSNTTDPVLPSSNVITSTSSQQRQQKISSSISSPSSTSSSNIPAASTRGSGSTDRAPQPQSIDNNKQALSGSSVEKVLIKGSQKSGPSNGLVIPAGSIIKSSSTTLSATTNPSSHNASTGNSNSVIVSQSENANQSQSKDPSSNPSFLPPQSTVPHNPIDKYKGTHHHHHVVTHPGPPLHHQPQPPTPIIPIPNPTNSTLVMPPAFIGPTVVPIFSPHYPPPPIHHQVVAMPPLPSPSPSSIIASLQPCAHPITTNNSSTANQTTENPIVNAPCASSSPPSSDSTTVTSPNTSIPPATKNGSSSAKPSDGGPIRVIYGLRIKPDGGCGSLYFKPSQPINKKQRKSNFAELSGLLKRKWTEVKDLQKKGSENYITVTDQ